MQLTTEALDRFIIIYEREFGETITRDEAAALAGRLVHLYRLFLRPLPPARGAGAKSPEGGDPSSPGT